MSNTISMYHAKKIAERAKGAPRTTVKVDESGWISADLMVDVAKTHLKVGKNNVCRVLIFESFGWFSDESSRLLTPAGNEKRAISTLVRLHPFEWQETLLVRVDIEATGHAGEWVDLIVVPLHSRLPKIVGLLLGVSLVTLAVALRPWADPDARRGHLPEKSPEEIQADIDAEVAWYQMAISVASAVEMVEGDTKCALCIENIEANHCDQKVRVYEAASPDDVLFESGAIAPGSYLETVELAHPLGVGTHELTVEFQGYESDLALITRDGRPLSHEAFGSVAAATVEVRVLPRIA